ncbi:MAG: glycosyltransferase family 39 protein [Rudaea sp.]|uniref:ArnT family glycosyltransferase n=1 Tax=Rudaea sp. TaxID=2136325 RepID=UPI0039E71FE5
MHEPFPASDKSARREFWLFLLFALIVIGAGIGLRDPWPADEPRFALSARQMVESGDWLIPRRGHEIYADKPPAFMAMQAAAFELVRNWRVAFLLPSLLAALGTLWLVYDLGRRLWGHRTGLYAGVALLCAIQFVYQAKRAQIDPTVTFFITLANYGLLRHFLLGPDWRLYWLGCFAAGLGVITKGVGVLALLMFVPYIFARRSHWNFVVAARGTARWAGGFAAFLAAIALWLVPLAIAVSLHPSSDYQTYLHDILFRQTAARYTDSWDHRQPPWYYFGVILTGWMPLWLVWFGTVPAWARAFRACDARLLLPLAWSLLVIAFFSIPSGKRDMYIMPALPMVALACAPYLAQIVATRWFRALALAVLVALGGALAGAGMHAWSGHWKFANDLAGQRGFDGGGTALWSLLIALGAWLLACAAWFRLARAERGLVAGLAGLWLLWGLWASPLLNDSSSAHGLMRRVGAMIGTDAELALVAWKEQNLLFVDREVVEFGFVKPAHAQLGEAIRWQEEKPDSRWVFVLADAMAPCIDQTRARYVGHANRREWWLFRSDAVSDACRGGNVPAPQKSVDAEVD